MPDHQTDSRRFNRIPFRAEIELRFGGGEYMGRLVDIALKGALVEMTAPLNMRHGESCRLVLPLGGQEEIIMEGRVVHQEGRRIGIECYHINMDSMTNLRRLVELNLGDTELLERELSRLFGA